MPNASNLKPDDRFIGLFVGPKHAGKTVAACSFLPKDPTKRRIKVFDFDGRIRGLQGAPWIDRSLVDYDYYPPRLKDGASTFDRINKDFDVLLTQCIMGQCPYGTIVIDSLTAMAFALICDALPLTHKDGKGKSLGVMSMPGMEDYGFEANGVYQVLSFLRSLPGIPNIICTAHTVEKFAKEDPDNPFSPSVVVGEKLSLRDKISANSSIYFDHIFRFDRKMRGPDEKFSVRFKSEIACTSFLGLPNGELDVTGKDFYKELCRLTAAETARQDLTKGV